MSIALSRSNSGDHRTIERLHGITCMAAIYKSADFSVGDRRSTAEEEDDGDRSSSTSSIGRNSDDSPPERSEEEDDVSDGEEVQSWFKNGGLSNLEDLEEVLPIKRGISNFYAGKSKSFTSLSEAASFSSLKEIVKPENPYTRKRKNELARNNFFDRNCNFTQTRNSSGMYKRPTNGRSSMALAPTTSCSGNSNTYCLPPLPPHQRQQQRQSNELSSSSSQTEQKFSAWRSFSLSDLQGAA